MKRKAELGLKKKMARSDGDAWEMAAVQEVGTWHVARDSEVWLEGLLSADPDWP